MTGLDAIRNLGGRAHRAQAYEIRGAIATHNYWSPLMGWVGRKGSTEDSQVNELPLEIYRNILSDSFENWVG